MPNPHPSKPFVSGDPRANRKGRPTKGNAIADWIRKVLDEVPTMKPRKSKTVRELFARSLVSRAVNGSNSAARLVLHYIEGLPVQTIRQIGDGGLSRIQLWDMTRADLEKMNNIEGQERKLPHEKEREP